MMDSPEPLGRENSVALEQTEPDIKQMYAHKIVSSASSLFTLEHRRQTPEEKKLIYCVRFDPDENKYLAIGLFYAYKIGFSDGCIGIYRVTNLEKITSLGEGILAEERLPVGGIRHSFLLTN